MTVPSISSVCIIGVIQFAVAKIRQKIETTNNLFYFLPEQRYSCYNALVLCFSNQEVASFYYTKRLVFSDDKKKAEKICYITQKSLNLHADTNN